MENIIKKSNSQDNDQEEKKDRVDIKRKSRRSLSNFSEQLKIKAFFKTNSFQKEHFKTKLECIIEYLHTVKYRLQLYQEFELADEIDWIIDIILKNQLNEFIINQTNNENYEVTEDEDLNTLKNLLAEYSSEYNFERTFNKIHKIILLRNKEKDKLKKKSVELIPNMQLINTINKIDIDCFSKDFDMWENVDRFGREQLFHLICDKVFKKLNLFSRISISSFHNFLYQLNNGYIKTNPYHNVYFYFNILGNTCS
jgi:hypothetical protein